MCYEQAYELAAVQVPKTLPLHPQRYELAQEPMQVLLA
jgi:hypothetical protein